MLVSFNEERSRGYGLPPTEYHALWDRRDDLDPLPASQFWIGRYQGMREAAVQATPLSAYRRELGLGSVEDIRSSGICHETSVRATFSLSLTSTTFLAVR